MLVHLALAIGVVLVAWFVQRRTRNAGIVDAAWVFSIGAGAALYAAFGPGPVEPRAVAGTLAVVWMLRLGSYLAWRNRGAEERRYAELRARWGTRADIYMLAFFVLQALIAWIVALTFLPIAFRPDAPSLVLQGVAVLIGGIGIVGEAVADAQLSRFRANPRNRGRVMDRGLWRYSRHPNFFFECVHWAAYPVLAIGAPLGALAWCGLILIAFLLLKVSGIPTVEHARAWTSRAGYADYVRRTSAFVPMPPRRS